MYKTPLVTCDDKRIRQASGYTAATLSKTASYTITAANIISAGGHLIVNVTAAAAAVDLSLPEASTVTGCRITMLKPSGNTNACAFLATGGDSVEGSTANKRFENATNEKGACTIWSDGADWRVISTKGTWAVNNT